MSNIEPRLEAVLVRLCERLGELYKTQAVKLPYLVDVVANHVLGESITGGTHQAWKMGVVTSEAYSYITHRDESDSPLKTRVSLFGRRLLRSEGPPKERLSDVELAIVDYVAEQYGSLSVKVLGDLTKALNSELPPEAWGSNRQARVDKEAYLRLDEGWQEFARRLPHLDLENRAHWSEPIQDDPAGHFKHLLASR